MKRISQHAILNNGTKMPRMGLGTWNIREEPEVNTLVEAFTKIGYRHLDTAAFYKNETQIGQALKKIFASGIKREEVFITTKLWNTDHGKVEEAITRSLERLNLDYVDMYLVHMPIAIKMTGNETTLDQTDIEKVPLSETWSGMEKCYQKGVTKNIGVSNFKFQLLNDLLTYAKIPPSVNQIELHPYLSQLYLTEWMKNQNIQPVAYSPLGAPYLVENTFPHDLDDPVINMIAKKHGKTPSQVILNWEMQRGHVVIPKSSHIERIKENFDAQFFEIEPEDMIEMNKLDRNLRIVGGAFRTGFLAYPIFD